VLAQKEFWKAVEERKIPIPRTKPRDLGKDRRGREIGSYSPEEYRAYLRREEEIRGLREKSVEFVRFRRKIKEEDGGDCEELSGKIEDERNRRILIARLEGRKMTKYEGDPEWDDVVPLPQVEGEGALAAIAYTDEYAEGMPSY
jgi:protein farnesyltransferase/geranylgeranyltransferase type-1 subunit alpha